MIPKRTQKNRFLFILHRDKKYKKLGYGLDRFRMDADILDEKITPWVFLPNVKSRIKNYKGKDLFDMGIYYICVYEGFSEFKTDAYLTQYDPKEVKIRKLMRRYTIDKFKLNLGVYEYIMDINNW